MMKDIFLKSLYNHPFRDDIWVTKINHTSKSRRDDIWVEKLSTASKIP